MFERIKLITFPIIYNNLINMSKKPVNKDDILAFLDAKFAKFDNKKDALKENKKRDQKATEKQIPPL